MKRHLPSLAFLAIVVICLCVDFKSHKVKSLEIMDLTISNSRLEKENKAYRDSLKVERGIHLGLNDLP